MTQGLGPSFARAVAAKDLSRVREPLHPELDFRAMTPARIWETEGPDDVLSALRTWFDDGDLIESIEALETDGFADRERVGYRLRGLPTDRLTPLDERRARLQVKETGPGHGDRR